MLDPAEIDEDVLAVAKRHLKVTWSDEETDAEVWERLCRAEYALNAKTGAAPDYFAAPCWEQALLLDYLLYMWNGCADQFDAAYYNDIQQLRATALTDAAESASLEAEVAAHLEDLQEYLLAYIEAGEY